MYIKPAAERERGYPHIFQSDICGRKGARCEIIGGKGFQVQIRFEDGLTLVVKRLTLRRAKIKAEENDNAQI